MLKHTSKRAGRRAATLAIAMASVGCTAMGSTGPGEVPCEAGDSGAAYAAPSTTVQNGDMHKPAVVDAMAKTSSVEERHFDIYKRFRALSAATGEVQVSGGSDGRGRGNAGMPAANDDSPRHCSIRDLKTSE